VTPRRRFLAGLIALPLAAGCRARVSATAAIEPRPGTIRVMTLNLAHGRARALTQTSARPASWYRRNLDAIAQVLDRERPVIVALQEAELGSRWAGGFDHVRYLAEASQMAYLHATPHMNEPSRFRYGTALLSTLPLLAPAGGTFEAGGRWQKGWTEASVDTAAGRVRFVSVHLDFARAARRDAQVRELADALRATPEPLVVMGDLNSTWNETERSAAALLADVLDLRAFRVDTKQAPTFGRRRIDWIMVTPPIEIAQRAVLTSDVLSDHRAVIVDLRLTGSMALARAGGRTRAEIDHEPPT
jgi:endonuclease/exonuclease/phosphatase family metal-dependent hydrolase